MSNNPNQPQTNDGVLGGQSSPTSLFQCPICKTEYTKGKVNRCSVCNWDLTPCPEAFVEKYNAQLAWAREMWINSQVQEKQLHASQSQLEEVKQDKARFEGEVLHRLERLEQVQHRSEAVIWTGVSQDTSKVDELEKQLLNIKEQLKEAQRERQELESEVYRLSAQVAKFEADPQKKIANDPALISEYGIDYSRLQKFLVAGEWEKANRETGVIISSILYRITEKTSDDKRLQEIRDYFAKIGYTKGWPFDYSETIFIHIYTEDHEEEYEKSNNLYNSFNILPCKDIKIIDSFWMQYSYNRFGFSVQRDLYELLNRDVFALAQSVEWGHWDREKDRYIPDNKRYCINAPMGHLPIVRLTFQNYKWDDYIIDYLPALLQKISSCSCDEI